MNAPELSVIIPVYNEEATLPALFARLYPALDALGVAYELLFINDGSSDRSAALLKDQFLARSDVTRVILFNANCGQHTAIMAGFEYCRGERVVMATAGETIGTSSTRAPLQHYIWCPKLNCLMQKYLKDARLNLGMSQSDVAKKLGISANYYSCIENGERQRIRKW